MDEVEDYFTDKESMIKIVKLGKEEGQKDSSYGEENLTGYDTSSRKATFYVE